MTLSPPSDTIEILQNAEFRGGHSGVKVKVGGGNVGVSGVAAGGAESKCLVMYSSAPHRDHESDAPPSAPAHGATSDAVNPSVSPGARASTPARTGAATHAHTQALASSLGPPPTRALSCHTRGPLKVHSWPSHTARGAPVACSKGALQVDGRARVFAEKRSSLRSRCL